MHENQSYRRTRSISEGNFHQCYASNKAEKFKLRKLSQGLESCAQVQALVFKKEENEVAKLLGHIDQEKRRHEEYRKHKDLYSNTNHDAAEPQASSSSRRRSSLQVPDWTYLSRRRSSQLEGLGEVATPTFNSNGSLKVERGSSSRSFTSQDGRRSRSKSHDVVPFYMQHGYSHYHHDQYYDNLITKKASNHSVSESVTEDEPSWKTCDKLTKLRRHTMVPDTTRIEKFLQDKSCKGVIINPVKSESNVDSIPGPKTLMDTKMLASQGHIKNQILPAIHSNLTPIERQELCKRRTSFRIESDERKLLKFITETQNKKRRHTFFEAGKSVIHRKILLEKLESELSDEVFDKLLDSCDGGVFYPANRTGGKGSMEEFRTLRKCKYLRLSKLNWESLKEAAKKMLRAEIL